MSALRLVAVADTHLFHEDLVVPDGDVFVHAGDLCRGGSIRELAGAAAWIRGLPHATKIIVPGNHDFSFERMYVEACELFDERTIVLVDAATQLAGLRIWGSPWQPEFNDWAFNLPRGDALRAKWALIPEGTDVLITHGPPAGIGDQSSMGGRQGCAELLARTREVKPWLHLFGHIHEDGGLFERDGITYVNCTTWECERGPTVLDLDLSTRRIEPVSVPLRAG